MMDNRPTHVKKAGRFFYSSTMENTILQLIDQYYTATTESSKQAIKNELFFQYYHLSVEERTNVRTAMRPFFDELELEMIEKDPIARQTYEMLK